MNEWIKQYSPNFNIARPGSESILSNTGHLASCGSQAGGQNKRITFFLSYRLSVWLKSERQHCLVASMKQAWWVHLNYKKNIQSMVLSGKLLLLSVCTTAFFHKRSAEMKVKNASNHLEKESVGLWKVSRVVVELTSLKVYKAWDATPNVFVRNLPFDE